MTGKWVDFQDLLKNQLEVISEPAANGRTCEELERIVGRSDGQNINEVRCCER